MSRKEKKPLGKLKVLIWPQPLLARAVVVVFGRSGPGTITCSHQKGHMCNRWMPPWQQKLSALFLGALRPIRNRPLRTPDPRKASGRSNPPILPTPTASRDLLELMLSKENPPFCGAFSKT